MLRVACSLLLATAVSACGDDATAFDGGPGADAAAPDATNQDSGPGDDTGPGDDAGPGEDAGPIVDASMPDVPPVPLTGALRAYLVAGMHYETPSFMGETNDAGEFQYLAGETIRFSIGDVVLAEVAAAEELTLFDLADAPRVTNFVEYTEAGPNFGRMLNMAVFLESLDTNGNATDGVVIEAAVASLLVGAEFDFGVPRQFGIQEGERAGYLTRAVTMAQGLFEVPHPISPTPHAAASLYAAAGLDMAISAQIRIERELTTNGTDGSSVAATYDPNGHIRTREEDFDGDGMIDRTIVWDYDAFDYSIRQGASTFTRDSAGNVEMATFRGGSRSVWMRDEFGAPLRQEDYSATGLRAVTTFTYEDGRVTLAETVLVASGALQRSVAYTYDAAGNELTQLVTTSSGPLSRTTNTYDDEGRRLTQETDNGADGSVERAVVTVYDAAGVRTMETVEDYAASVLTRRSVTIYEADGGSVTMTDTNGDGSVNDILTVVLSSGLRTESLDEGADGSIDVVSTETFDANGSITLLERDLGNDGTIDERTVYTNEPTGWFGLGI